MSPLSHLLDTHAESIGFVQIPAPRESQGGGRQPRADHLTAEAARKCACGQHRLQVVSVPAGDSRRDTGRRDYFVICSCGCARMGWYDVPPSERDITCEACAERAEALSDFDVFAAGAAQRGWRVETV